jgi:hypothetical protein
MTIMRKSIATLSLTSLELIHGGRPSGIEDGWVPFPVEPPHHGLDLEIV